MENHRIKVFIDTNIIITGVFFSGYEVLLLNLPQIDIFTADVCIEESRNVVQRLFRQNKEKSLAELWNSMISFDIVHENEYSSLVPQVKILIPNKNNDQKVLAAALYVDPDYFISRDSDFDRKDIRKLVNLKTTKEVLSELGVA